MNELERLLVEIQDARLDELAKTKSEYVYTTAYRIVTYGKDLECQFPDMKADFDEDTKLSAMALSDPKNWGIDDPSWNKFCAEREES